METAAPFILIALLAWLWQRRLDRRYVRLQDVRSFRREVGLLRRGPTKERQGTDPGADFKWGGSS